MVCSTNAVSLLLAPFVSHGGLEFWFNMRYETECWSIGVTISVSSAVWFRGTDFGPRFQPRNRVENDVPQLLGDIVFDTVFGPRSGPKTRAKNDPQKHVFTLTLLKPFAVSHLTACGLCGV
jgi:hypothetical protein